MSDLLGLSFVAQAVSQESESKPAGPSQLALDAMRSRQVIGDHGLSTPSIQRRAEFGNPGLDGIAGRKIETSSPGYNSKGLDTPTRG